MVQVNLAELAPNMPEKKRKKLASAGNIAWETHGDINQADLFDKKWKECVGYYYAENTPLAKAIMQLFRDNRGLVEAWVKEFSYSEDKVGGIFKGDLATGSQETTIRPIQPETFANAEYTQDSGVAAGDTINLIPDDGVADGSVETATEDEETWLILGYAEFIAGVPIATIIQEFTNDGEGLRNPLYIYPQQAMTNLLLAERSSPLWIETGHTLDIDYYLRNDTVTGMWPIGLECIVESAITDIRLA